MFHFMHFDKTTISKKVVDDIKNLIVTGKLQPNEKLPPERELAKMLNVSRNTVREAYKILAALGFVQIQHGKGVFVSDEDTSLDQFAATFFIKNDRILELFEIRKLLETQSVRWAAERATPQAVQELRQMTDEACQAAEKGADKLVLARADQAFHLYLAEMSGNSVLLRIMHHLIDLFKESREETLEIPGRAVKSLEEHRDIIRALAQHDPKQAERNMLKHLSSVEKALIRKFSDEPKS
ncbi:MAG: FadR family transcriptional regulator [Bacillaceae bacterium]|nr:FadR family transcriptional regulator [Bacillaceae bacterium]